MKHRVIPISAFKDNYIWLVINIENQHGFIVDPGEANAVLKALDELNITLTAILITHHHADHSAGINSILQYKAVPVFGPAHERISGISQKVKENDEVKLSEVSTILSVIDIPGHTLGHVAYYGQNFLFCGDTLFTAGCGRLFEGTAEQMYQSLCKLMALPEETLVYCGHEYTELNLRFASLVEPHNTAIKDRIETTLHLRQMNLPTVPSTLKEEKKSNLFLRCHIPEVINSAEKYAGKKLNTPLEVFTVLRAWKDESR